MADPKSRCPSWVPLQQLQGWRLTLEPVKHHSCATRAREAEQAACDASHHSTPDSASNSRSSQKTQPEERQHYHSVTATYGNWNMKRGAEINAVPCIERQFAQQKCYPVPILKWFMILKHHKGQSLITVVYNSVYL